MNLFSQILNQAKLGTPWQFSGGTSFGSINTQDFQSKLPTIQKNVQAEQNLQNQWFSEKEVKFLKLQKDKWVDMNQAMAFVEQKRKEEAQKVEAQKGVLWSDANREWFMQNALGVWADFLGWVASEVPKVIGETTSFLSKAGQYTPTNLLATWVKAGFSDKTFWQLMDEQSQRANVFAESGQKSKEDIQKLWVFDPNTTSAKLWETVTDIGSAFVWPNKVWVIRKLWKLATPAKIAMEWGLAWAKFDIASQWKVTPESVLLWAWWNLWIAWAFKWGQKIAKVFTPKTAEEKILESVWGKTVKWIVQWKTVKIQEPKEGIITRVSTPFRTKDSKVLTWRALTPSYAWKTPKQMLKWIGEMTDNVKSFYEQVRTWKMKGNVNTLEDSANSVISNLDEIGANIGNSVKWAKWSTSISMWTRSEMSKALRNKIEKRAWAYSALQNFYKDTSKWLNLNDAFKAKRVYQTEIGKLIRSWDAGTDSYSALVKWVQELSDNIDTIVEKSIWTKQFIEWKKQYKLLKSIASDISKSAVVEGRRAPQTFVEQLGMLESIVEWVTNPLSTAKSVLAKEIGELNTRGWAWKELIKNYDKEAIQKAKKIIPKKIPVWR